MLFHHLSILLPIISVGAQDSQQCAGHEKTRQRRAERWSQADVRDVPPVLHISGVR
jgi:hypothetical protein